MVSTCPGLRQRPRLRPDRDASAEDCEEPHCAEPQPGESQVHLADCSSRREFAPPHLARVVRDIVPCLEP